MDDKFFELVGLVIRRLRELQGVSQETFARRAGLDRAFYGRIERGKHNLSLRTLRQIAHELDVQAWEILIRAEPDTPSDEPVGDLTEELRRAKAKLPPLHRND